MGHQRHIAILTRKDLEQREETFLGPYAVFSGRTKGRIHAEDPHPFRTEFQRDRDRVIHSSAFRRLEYKTQVFVNHEGDYYRTRLTHTLETAQIARTLARSLRLNEDLVETAALAHDLGHTPFGHAGQDVMDELMKPFGGFEHNLQSLRIVELMETRYPQFPGLNLCEESREAIAKHSPKDVMGLPPGWPSLEGQLVDTVDSIAYLSADLDDGLRSGILTPEQISKLDLVSQALDRVRLKAPDLDIREHRRPLISEIINILTHDLMESTALALDLEGVDSLAKVRSARQPLVGFSIEVGRSKARVHTFLMEHFYRHHKVQRMAVRAREVLFKLFETFCRHPEALPAAHQENCRKFGKERAVCDYIAGMTDRFALEEVAQISSLRP